MAPQESEEQFRNWWDSKAVVECFGGWKEEGENRFCKSGIRYHILWVFLSTIFGKEHSGLLFLFIYLLIYLFRGHCLGPSTVISISGLTFVTFLSGDSFSCLPQEVQLTWRAERSLDTAEMSVHSSTGWRGRSLSRTWMRRGFRRATSSKNFRASILWMGNILGNEGVNFKIQIFIICISTSILFVYIVK